MTTALAWGLLGITLLLNLIATIQLLRSDFETRLQKAAQFSLIWLLPIVGAIIVIAVRAPSLHATRPDRSSDATGVSLYSGSAVTRLSTFSEAQILELVSAGKIRELFPFRPRPPDTLPADTEDEHALVEVSALPMSRDRQAALIQSSMPSSTTRTATRTARKTPSAEG